jgi:hypothetical protein
MPEAPPRGRITPAGALAAAAGLALFWMSIRRAGLGEIAGAIGRLGAGFFLVLGLSSIREAARTAAWLFCIEPPHRLPVLAAFRARVTGEALGNLTPLGLLISEPAKAVCARPHLPLGAALEALAVETMFYSLTVAAVIVAGTVALLAAFPVPEPLRTATITGLVAMSAAGLLMLWLMAVRPKLIAGSLGWLHGRGAAPAFVGDRLEHLRAVEERVYGFFVRHPGRVVPIALADVLFHAAGVAEVYVTLAFITDATALTWLTAFVLEAVNRIVTVAFKFIPLRLGVDEAASGLVATVLGFGAAAGVALAIVRKARVLFWSALGVVFLAQRGLSIRRVLDEAQVAMARERP